MTLRTRLLVAVGLILAVVVAGGFLIVQDQHQNMISQVDAQLITSRPLFHPPDDTRSAVDRAPGQRVPGQDPVPPDDPLSNLYVGQLDGGVLSSVLRGQLLDDVPAVSSSLTEAVARDDAGPMTVSGAADKTRFRVILRHDAASGAVFVIGLPLDAVDHAILRLRAMLLVGGGVIALVLAAAAWSVERLGLRPVAKVTEAADAITGGARGVRVEVAGRSTEADRLATAFNVMLDEREADEDRLRQFISDASHELRTPLTSIRGYLELYQSGGFREPDRLDDVIARLLGESIRMQALVTDLLALARMDEQAPLHLGPVDIGPILNDAAADALAREPGRPIDVDLPSTPTRVVGNDPRLRQLVGILVSNALEHTPPGTPVHLAATSGNTGCTITVADEGPGLVAGEAARVFDRFHRGDPSRARTTGGFGLGLAIAKSIVQRHGGTIEVQTAPGAGCTFRVHLPGNVDITDRD